jgi:hypothetical protein
MPAATQAVYDGESNHQAGFNTALLFELLPVLKRMTNR